MYEKYELPIRFTEEQRKKYAEWGIKKGKVLMPMAAVTIGIDLLTVLWVVGRVWLIRESDPIWFQIICQFFLPIQNPRIARSLALLSIGTSPFSRNTRRYFS